MEEELTMELAKEQIIAKLNETTKGLMKSITNFIANYKTTLAGVVLGILTIAQQAGCIAPNDLVRITGLLTSLGLFVAKDADRTGVL